MQRAAFQPSPPADLLTAAVWLRRSRSAHAGLGWGRALWPPPRAAIIRPTSRGLQRPASPTWSKPPCSTAAGPSRRIGSFEIRRWRAGKQQAGHHPERGPERKSRSARLPTALPFSATTPRRPGSRWMATGRPLRITPARRQRWCARSSRSPRFFRAWRPTRKPRSSARCLHDRSRDLAQISAEALDALAGVLQRRGGGGVGNAEGRAVTERRSLHHRDAFRFQELGDEILVGLERLAGRRLLADRAGAGRKHVERALRLRADDALRVVEHGDAEVAPLLEDPVVLRDEVLRPVERLDRGPLRDRGRVRGRLRLDHRHRLDERLRPAGKADAPAGHAVSLRHAVERQGALVEPRLDLRRREELEVVVDEG